MIELRNWGCGTQACRNRAFGVGSPVALRALGWQVELRSGTEWIDVIHCPLHHGIADIPEPEDRLAAALHAAQFHQVKLAAPVDGAPRKPGS